MDSVDKTGCTALHIAALYGHELLSGTLLNYGADPTKPGFQGTVIFNLLVKTIYYTIYETKLNLIIYSMLYFWPLSKLLYLFETRLSIIFLFIFLGFCFFKNQCVYCTLTVTHYFIF